MLYRRLNIREFGMLVRKDQVTVSLIWKDSLSEDSLKALVYKHYKLTWCSVSGRGEAEVEAGHGAGEAAAPPPGGGGPAAEAGENSGP